MANFCGVQSTTHLYSTRQRLSFRTNHGSVGHQNTTLNTETLKRLHCTHTHTHTLTHSLEERLTTTKMCVSISSSQPCLTAARLPLAEGGGLVPSIGGGGGSGGGEWGTVVCTLSSSWTRLPAYSCLLPSNSCQWKKSRKSAFQGQINFASFGHTNQKECVHKFGRTQQECS